MTSCTTGAFNVAVGGNALESITTNAGSTAVGNESIRYNTGANNTAVGEESLFGVGGSSTGANNVAMGWHALHDLTTAANNVAIGYNAHGTVTTGGTNTSLGASAGVLLTTGAECLHLGQNVASANTTGNNTINIGYNTTSSSATVNHELTIGNSNISSFRCNTTSISSLSDERDKAQITDLPEEAGIDFINKLKPRTFYWDRREWYDNGVSDGSKIKPDYKSWKTNSGQRMGFVSQEVQTAIAGLKYMEDSKIISVAETTIGDTVVEKLEFAPNQLITPLIKAVQQLSAEVESLKAQLGA
jgi:hypothetical protein